MFDRIFGRYLFDTKRITRRQLKLVYEEQAVNHAQIGLIAVREGLMTKQQSAEVNRMQRHSDERFGDMAVEMGYLNEQQLERLVSLQQNRFLSLTQAFVSTHIMELKRIKELEEEYRVTNGWMISEMATLESEDNERIIPLFLQSGGSFDKYAAAMCIKSFYRLVDSNIGIGPSRQRGTFKFESAEMFSLEGALSFCALAGKEEDLRNFASKYLGVEIINRDSFEMDEINQAAKEFLTYSLAIFSSELPGHHDLISVGQERFFERPGHFTGSGIITTPVIMDNGVINIVTSQKPCSYVRDDA